MENLEPKSKDMKEMGMPKDKVEGFLACNSSFTGPGPAPGAGMDQAAVDKWWNAEKSKLVNQIIFDTRKCELLEGNEVFTEVSFILSRQIHSANWLAKCGWRRVWGSMLSKARAKALQNMANKNVIPIAVAAEKATFDANLKTMLNKIKNKVAN